MLDFDRLTQSVGEAAEFSANEDGSIQASHLTLGGIRKCIEAADSLLVEEIDILLAQLLSATPDSLKFYFWEYVGVEILRERLIRSVSGHGAHNTSNGPLLISENIEAESEEFDGTINQLLGALSTLKVKWASAIDVNYSKDGQADRATFSLYLNTDS